jgi:hypothetical protein
MDSRHADEGGFPYVALQAGGDPCFPLGVSVVTTVWVGSESRSFTINARYSEVADTALRPDLKVDRLLTLVKTQLSAAVCRVVGGVI